MVGLETWEGKLCVFGLHDSQEAEHTTEPTRALYAALAVAESHEAIRERLHELTSSRHSGKDVQQMIATLNPVLRG